MTKAIVSALAGLTMLVATEAQAKAAVGEEIVSIEVRYGDLNLHSQEGRRELDRRVNAAVREICQDFGTRDLAEFMAVRRCVKEASKSGAVEVEQLVARFEPATRG